MEEIVKPKSRVVRISPTDKQIKKLSLLNDDELFARALEAMHSLNRRAKKIRDNKNQYRRASFANALVFELEQIYDLKNEFIQTALLDGRGKLYTFFQQDMDYDDLPIKKQWFIVRFEKHSFHMPPDSINDVLVKTAIEIEPHDPTQAQKEIPDVGLTIKAQVECVKMSIERMTK